MSLPSEIVVCPACAGSIDAAGIEVGAEIGCPYCGGQFPYRPAFGPYRLEQRLGSGGTGIVYLATRGPLDEPVAVKILDGRLAAQPALLETFHREAKTATELSHPNIVRVLGSGEEGGRPYLAMEYLGRGSLEGRIASGRLLDEREALDAAAGIVAGLRFAAGRGLIHRDIKPGNILFAADGTPKIVDFGLSLRVYDQQEATAEVWGTPYYLPPERLDREKEDFRSDIYSLGATLFHALAGRPPYLEKDPQKLAQRHHQEPPPMIRALAPRLSPVTARIVDRSLALRREDRFPSYEALAEEIGKARTALEPGRIETKKPARQYRPGLIVLGALAALAALLGAGLLLEKLLR